MENNNNLDELLLIGDYSICQYSGLPSVSSYTLELMEEENVDFYAGHS
jgi:hypothetical protein